MELDAHGAICQVMTKFVERKKEKREQAEQHIESRPERWAVIRHGHSLSRVISSEWPGTFRRLTCGLAKLTNRLHNATLQNMQRRTLSFLAEIYMALGPGGTELARLARS